MDCLIVHLLQASGTALLDDLLGVDPIPARVPVALRTAKRAASPTYGAVIQVLARTSELAPPYPQQAGLTGAEISTLLTLTNRFRCMHGSPALRWNPALAASAYTFAKSATSLGTSVPSSTDAEGGPSSENQLQMWPHIGSMEQAVTKWYDEIQTCRGVFPGCKNGTDNSANSFTAMIWKGAKVMGCALSDNQEILVCRYGSGPGSNRSDVPNALGGYIVNVLKQTKSSKKCSLIPGLVTSSPLAYFRKSTPSSTPSSTPTSSRLLSPACGDIGIDQRWNIILEGVRLKSCNELLTAGGCDVEEWRADILPKTCPMTCGLCAVGNRRGKGR